MDTYAVLKEEKVPLHGLFSFELQSISDKIYRQFSIPQTLNNPWKVVVTDNIHPSIYYKFFRAIRDFNIKFGLSTSTKRDKKDKIKTLTVLFTYIRSAIYHLSKGLDDSKDSAKSCYMRTPIVMEYAYSKSKLTISGAYEVKNCYGNVVSTMKTGT